MADVYFYDGRFVLPGEPVVTLDDRGYCFGDGVYDAWMVHHGRHFLRRDHLDRLEGSAAALGITLAYSRAEIEAFTDELLARSGLGEALVYLQATRGRQLPRAHVAAPGLRSVLSGFIKAASPLPESLRRSGCDVILHPDERQHFCHVKSLNLLGSVLASNAAAAAGCHEAILVRDLGHAKVVTECAHSNCFAVKGGVIHTAPLGKLILPGITRKVVLGLAGELEIPVAEGYQPPEFFLGADEVFLSAASGLVPVGRIDGQAVGSGRRPIFDGIDDAYRRAVASLQD